MEREEMANAAERLVVICNGRELASPLEETIRSEGYELKRVPAGQNLLEIALDSQLEAAVALVVGTDFGPKGEVILAEATRVMPAAKFLVVSGGGQDIPGSARHLLEAGRTLCISGEDGTEQSLSEVRRFLHGDGYLWASDLQPNETRTVFLLGEECVKDDSDEGMWLRSFVRELSAYTEFTPMVKVALRKCMEMVQCEAGSLYLWDEFREKLVLTAAEGPEQGQRLGLTQGLGEGLAGWVAEAGEPILVTDVSCPLITVSARSGLETTLYGVSTSIRFTRASVRSYSTPRQKL